MIRRALFATLASALAACTSNRPAAPAVETHPAVPSPIAQRVAAFESRPGLLDLYVDAAGGKLYALLPSPGADGVLGEYLYVEGIVTGLGSNPVGLDRGQIGATRVLVLREVGGKILFEAQNLGSRASGADADLARSVEESFAPSVLWGTEVLARETDGRRLVELTGFALRDAHGVAEQLATSGEGSYALERERSAVDLTACRAFPENVEIEARLTFTGSRPGERAREVGEDPRALTFVQHQSLVRLPEPGYRPRVLDPRMGSYAISFRDFGAPLAEPIEKSWIVRHRLEKVDPTAVRSAVKRPIVYYVDRAIPEPVRSAVLEGASWWAGAFDAAGFENAFRVELLPEGVDPLDLRYNVIQWVHRSTRGWSYGGGVIDPRTGEMVKGHVTLGSLRVRQDRLLFEALLGAEGSGKGGPNDPVELALARIRQLAAHEVGHALGLAHNFAASTYGDRASVMDYPAPLVRIGTNGELDLSKAYAPGLGVWDATAIRWAYSEYATEAEETNGQAAIVAEALAQGYLFLTDEDARPAGAANPRANLWDNGDDPVSALDLTARVRRVALAHFGERNIPLGAPLARLEETLAPLYLWHRYQMLAAAKLLGGVDYRYAVRGDGQPAAARPVAPERQRRALTALLDTLTPAFLDLPEETLRRLLPRAPGTNPNAERLGRRTAPTFDALGAAATAADLTLRALLQPERAARLVDQHRRNAAAPDFDEVLEAVTDGVFVDTTLLEPRLAEIARVVQRVYADRLIELSGNAAAAPWVRSRVDVALSDLLQRLDRMEPLDGSEKAHFAALAAEIGRHLARPAPAGASQRVAPVEPPGDPIGAPVGEGFLEDSWFEPCDFQAPS